MLVQIERWIEDGEDYQEGILILKKVDPDSIQVAILSKGENSYTKKKLFKLLNESKLRLKNDKSIDLTRKVIAQPPRSNNDKKNNPSKKNGLKVNDFFKLPEKLQRKRMEIGEFFKVAIIARKLIRSKIGWGNKGTVTLSEAFIILNQTDSYGKGIPVQLSWITYNEDQQSGGELIETNVIKKISNTTGTKYTSVKKGSSRDPRHSIHGTFNVQLAETILTRKIHSWLIFRVDGYDVILTESA